MNRFTKSTFADIQAEAKAFQNSTKQALAKYRQSCENARREAKQFKDEQGHIQQIQGRAAQEARTDINSALYVFQTKTRHSIASLRDELADHKTKTKPAEDFYNTLDIYRKFGLTPNEEETAALIAASRGSYLAVRALNSVLEQTKSDFRVSTTAATDFNNDLALLDSLLDPSLLCSPDGYEQELTDIYKGEKNYSSVNDEWTDTFIPLDGLGIILKAQSFDQTVSKLDGMAERWSGSVLPSLTRYQTDSDADKEEKLAADYADTAKKTATIERHSDDGVEYAKQLGKQQTEQGRAADEAIAYFGG